MKREDFKILLNKYVSGEATDAERRLVEAYYDRRSEKEMSDVLSPEDVEAMERAIFEGVLRRAGIMGTAGVTGTAGTPQGLPDSPDPTGLPARVRRMVWRKYAVAAAVVLLCAMAWLLWSRTGGSSLQDRYAVLNVAPGKIMKITLSDGTLVWVNSGSELRYPNNFDGTASREVYVDGEAYFEVARDEQHPFLVHSGDLITKVLGTRFDVKAYKEEKRIEVTLLEGKVMLTAAQAGSDTVFLKPNEKAFYVKDKLLTKESMVAQKVMRPDSQVLPGGIAHPQGGGMVLSKVNAPFARDAAAWIDSDLIFRDETLETVIRALERRYNIEVRIAPSFLDKRITIDINTQSADQALLEVTKQIKRMPGGGSDGQLDLQFKKIGNVYYLK